MSEVYPLLATLSVNHQFMSDFLSAETPCFALGMVEEGKRRCAFLALRPNEVIPPEISDAGFLFGHGLIGNADFEVVHFAFHFYGFKTYNVLVNPNNPLVQTVLTTMVESGAYFFFAAQLGGARNRIPVGIRGSRTWPDSRPIFRIRRSAATEAQYRREVSYFEKNPDPPGVLLKWVCRDYLKYVDVSKDWLDLIPSGGRKSWD